LSKLQEIRLRNTTSGSIKLKRLAELIKKKGEDFESQYNEIRETIQFEAWFSTRYWQKGLAFIGSMAGIAALLAVIYFCTCRRHTDNLMKTLLFLGATQPRVRALEMHTPPSPFICPESVDLTAKALTSITISHLFTMTIVLLMIYWGKKMVQFCCREARVFRPHPSLAAHPKTELLIPLGSKSSFNVPNDSASNDIQIKIFRNTYGRDL